MSATDFEAQCKALCPYCRDGVAVRVRVDTGENVHDTAIPIPGTLGKRQGHAYCTASEFRNVWKEKLSG